MNDIVERVIAGDKRAISRAISLVEDEAPAARDIMKELHRHTGRAHIIGVTGPPGVGKSTLVDALATEARQAGESVGIVAVDPTSPFTGGALLGDRIRMQRHALDPDVFVRSLATRGRVGGLSAATASAVRILDASGKQVVLVETVGAGQSEVEIMRLAHTVLVVLAPGLGDDIQAIKAGILEIADIMVVNKADMDGAQKTARELENAIDLRSPAGWRPPVMLVTAKDHEGVAPLYLKAREHIAHLRSGSGLAERLFRAAQAEVQEIVVKRLMREVGGGEDWPLARDLVQSVANRAQDPHSVADELINGFVARITASK